MKYFKLFFLFALFTFLANNKVQAQSMARVEVETDTVAIGCISSYVKSVNLEIPIRNAGNTSLTIYKIKSDCICTTTQFERTPIKAGETCIVKVKIETGDFFAGDYTKSIMLYTNGVELQKQIYFTFTKRRR